MLLLFFIIYFYIIPANIVQYLYNLYILLVEYPLVVWGAEPTFELGPALQKADVLLPEPRGGQTP
jgi:hypothetical protein